MHSRTLSLRFGIITQWKAAGVDYQEKGDPAIVKVHTQKGVNIIIVGCISARGIIDFLKVEPLKKSDAAQIEKEFGSQQTSKKRKASTPDAGKNIKKEGSQGDNRLPYCSIHGFRYGRFEQTL
ncbi:hypothetical protein CLU79DRAFT_441833 [Phycomyces nitens]|nr:hypothetical protein CLU79DRAFT_441833 [Phycomyces nitens]